MDPKADSTLETIVQLALQLAQHCPNCAERATRIADLASGIRAGTLEQGALRDAIDSSTLDSDLSNAQVDATVNAVMKMNRDTD